MKRSSMKYKKLLKVNFPIIIGLIIALTVLYTGEEIEMANSIGLIIALISVAGSILANFFQYKKDSNKISEVKIDTSNMLPKVDTINENTKNINKYVVDDIKSSLKDITHTAERICNSNEAVNSDIKLIVDDVKYRNRLSKEYSGLTNRDVLITNIDEIYKNNAHLSVIIREKDKSILELKKEISEKDREISQLKRINMEYSNKNINLENRIAEFEREHKKNKEYGLEL